jgi:hypothetical protein
MGSAQFLHVPTLPSCNRPHDEIYAPIDSRDVNAQIEKFLGRQRSLEPFSKKLGIEQK